MPILTDWDDIQATQEFKDDYKLLFEIMYKAIGHDAFVPDGSDASPKGVAPFLFAAATLLATHRYFIRHQPELQDIDETLFLELLRNEVGFDLPLTQSIPILEFLRENKHWYDAKGTESVYQFIGTVINSPIEIQYPKDHLFALDDVTSYLDGDVSPGVMLPWKDSKLARIRDGIFWAQFTYIVRVLQAQNIRFLSDLFTLLHNVHPAGTQEFLYLEYRYTVDASPESVLVGNMQSIKQYWLAAPDYPVLDDHFILDETTSSLDTFGHDGSLFVFSIQFIP